MNTTTETKPRKHNRTGERLRARGFDRTTYDRESGYYHVRCSQCQALVIVSEPLRIEAYRLKYHSLPKSHVGGWNYTRTLLGETCVAGMALDDAITHAARQFKGATDVRVFAQRDDGSETWVCSTNDLHR